ncbi:MAG: DUF4194 domain-containing protein [Micrococcales bacterium]|nr:DUF4194 domain-containing protein [Micrococcales bacterium]
MSETPVRDDPVALDDAAPADAPDDGGGFIAPVSMEDDPSELFPGDRGTLDAEVRTVLVRLLQRRFLLAEKNPAQWRTLLENQPVVESRLHDLYVQLVVDHERGIAYKKQVRAAETEVPVLLRDEPYTRAETLVLVHLRAVYQRERGGDQTSVRIDVEDVEQAALTYFYDPADTNPAAHQKEVRGAVERLRREGIIEEESEGRFRITGLIEVVLSNERLTALRDWLRHDQPRAATDGDDGTDTEVAP